MKFKGNGGKIILGIKFNGKDKHNIFRLLPHYRTVPMNYSMNSDIRKLYYYNQN